MIDIIISIIIILIGIFDFWIYIKKYDLLIKNGIC